MQILLKDDTQVCKQFVENDSYRRTVREMVYQCWRRPKTEPGEKPNLLCFAAAEKWSDHHGHDWQDPANAQPGHSRVYSSIAVRHLICCATQNRPTGRTPAAASDQGLRLAQVRRARRQARALQRRNQLGGRLRRAVQGVLLISVSKVTVRIASNGAALGR